jgi:hypothetical protein
LKFEPRCFSLSRSGNVAEPSLEEIDRQKDQIGLAKIKLEKVANFQLPF